VKKLITEKFALRGLLTILSLIVVFHFLVLLGIIPFEIVWGGRLKDHSQMLAYETVSITLNLVMLTIVGVKADVLKLNVNRMILNVALWFMFGLFLLNTIGNLFSINEFEKMVFTPLTLILAIFSLRAAINKDKK
jgi:hypothetical protein